MNENELILIKELLKENYYNICKDEEQSHKYNQAFVILDRELKKDSKDKLK